MRRHLALFVMAGTLGVCTGYGQEPSKKDAPKPATATGQKSSPAKVIVLVDDSDVDLPADIHEYQVEIRDIPLSKLLATVKASSSGPIALKGDVGEMRTGHVLLDGRGLAHLVESLPDMVDGLEVKKTPPSQGGTIIFSRAKTGGVVLPAAAVPDTERQVIPVNLRAYMGQFKEDLEEQDNSIKMLQISLEKAFLAKAGGDEKKAGKVDLEVHFGTKLGLLAGKSQDLAFAMTVLQALGIKTPAVSMNSNLSDLPESSWIGPAAVTSGFRVSTAPGQRIPMIPGGLSGGMMNPTIPMVSGQALSGTNNHLNTQEILATLKKNQEQIANLTATVSKLQQELDAAKKGAGK